MSFSVGIVGLPNVGKSTLFKILTKRAVAIAPYPFTTIKPNVGIVSVPDERLEKIAQLIKANKITPTFIEFVDIAGLVKDAHKGEGLGNQFLAQIRNCDAILEVVRCFGENIRPKEDIETIMIELEMKDRESKEKENLLSKKPIIYLLNTDNINHKQCDVSPLNFLKINLKEEEEFSELDEKTKKELGYFSCLDQVIVSCYNILDLITFYTIKDGQARAWTIKRGVKAPKAGRIIHSDFEEKFIRAEVINYEQFIQTNGWKEAKEKGLIQIVGKEYIVRDGDIIEFKI
jgi:ribosome-binding ATPase YchF (GTP1/OBG family)